MKSSAKDVTTYIREAPAERQACLSTMRSLCRATLTGYEEGMEHGMPSYKKDGNIEVAFASQANYISLYILKKDVVDANRDALTGANVGKGCIRYSVPEKINFDVVKNLLSGTLASSSRVC
ncbi:MAG: DUF1801 domain-containing protein [Akkermansiaceae bacterium]|nr:DUF1801 domain-containing protein [Armatimonadota bacterium]